MFDIGGKDNMNFFNNSQLSSSTLESTFEVHLLEDGDMQHG